jgi:hypothetical protein
MKGYIGVENIFAEPINAVDYYSAIEKDILNEEGYRVKYERGNTSWFPKKEFKKTYQEVLNFSKLPYTKKELLPTYQQRVIDEYEELFNKNNTLGNFIQSEMFKSINTQEQERLKKQNIIMIAYLNILYTRILNF